mgnify:CR=1 FL=1
MIKVERENILLDMFVMIRLKQFLETLMSKLLKKILLIIKEAH